MATKKTYNFGEKDTEFYKGQQLQVWQSPKYEAAKKKAVEIIESGKYGLSVADFWILMNTYNKGTKMMYTGLILSHNGCLKINDRLENKFSPSSVSLDKAGYGESLVFTYCNEEQGIYEVGEVASGNCKLEYPYAMAFKRCFDRVVLKLSKLAFDGIYSDSESEDFKADATDYAEKESESNSAPAPEFKTEPVKIKNPPNPSNPEQEIIERCKALTNKVCELTNREAKSVREELVHRAGTKDDTTMLYMTLQEWIYELESGNA